MCRRFLCLLVAILLLAAIGPLPVLGQGELQLPADLFILTEGGQVMRIEASGGFAALVTPSDQVVADFGVAPDGQWIAYRTMPVAEDAVGYLAMTALDGLSGQVLEFEGAGQAPITGRGQTIAWSPDGTVIAYTTGTGSRVYFAGLGEAGGALFQDIAGGPFINLLWSPGGGFLAAEAEGNLWTIYRRDTSALVEVLSVPAGMTWASEGLIAATPSDGGLLLINAQDFSQTVLVDPAIVASQPALIPGERLIFLVHEANGQRFAARRFGTVSLSGEDLQTTEATVEMTAAMRWLPDGTALLASVDGALTIIEPRTNSRRELMDGVKAYNWGPLPPEEVAGAVLPANLYFISADVDGVTQIWRLPADGSPAGQITAEVSSVIDFAVSPDEARIAYTVGGSLVVSNSDGSESRELSSVADRPGAGGQPAWSPDGAVITFVRDGIWEVPSVGGRREELIADSLDADTPPEEVRVYSRPRWNPSGTLLLVNINYYEGGSLGILPSAAVEVFPLPVATSHGAWLPNGLILTWEYDRAYTTPGLYVVNPADPTAAVQILGETWPVYDAIPLANEAVMVLRATGPDAVGPSSAQPFLVPILPDALPIPNGQGGPLENPVLAPGGTFVAGLREMRQGDYGPAGRLAVINLETGERFAIQTPGVIWSLQWGLRR